ncbi:MAG TPA: DNA polymerase III subunit delta [Burkholderiales bacterium]|nr:DNA polymerase III subunit delta [Burkholderiales bacterium]
MIKNINDLLNISDNTPPVCLISSTEEYYPLLHFTINEIKNKLNKYNNHNSFNIDKDSNWEEIVQKTTAKNLFEEKNYTEIIFKTKPMLEQEKNLIKIFDELNSDNFLLIITDKLDKKDMASNWLIKIKEKGVAVNLSNTDITPLINYKLLQNNLTIESDALNLLIQQNIANTHNLIQDLTKITILYSKKHISLSDIQSISTNNSRYNIYQLSNTYLSGDLQRSLSMFNNIYQSTEDEILLIWIIAEDLRKLIKIKALIKKGLNLTEIFTTLKVWGEAVNHLKSAYQRLSYNTLIKLFDKLSVVDMIIKGINTGNVKLELLQIITLICMGEETNAKTN